VIAVIVILGQLVQLNEVSWWRESKLLPFTVEFAGWIRNFAETGMQMVGADASERA
jgi:uncharacterized membrane protein required for colicin V production